MDGFGVIKKLRQDDELRTIPVVVLTAKTLTDDDEKWLWERNIPVIRKKNLTTKELLKELRDALSTNHLGGNVHEEASFGN
jgi:CheY-like chemotaxis protein